MNFKKTIFVLIFTQYSLFADNFRTQLIINSVNISDPSWQFGTTKINQKENGIFERLIEKWNLKLKEFWNQLSDKIYKEIGLTAHEIDYFLNDPLFMNAYINYYQKHYNDLVRDQIVQKTDPVVSSFIKKKLHLLKIEKNLKFNVINNTSLLAKSFGTDKNGHYLIFHQNFYNSRTSAI